MTRNIRALTIAGPGADFELSDVELDDPAAGEVLVRVEAVGMCHADLAVRAGDFPFPLPGVAGHEGAGRVEAVGAGVTSVRPGDRVMLTFDSCGHCAGCVAGTPTQCRDFVAHNFTNGARPDGSPTLWRAGTPVHGSFFGQSSFATFALAGERNAVPVIGAAAELAPELLAPLGCGVQTGAGAVLNVLRPRAGDSLVVFGAGAVGLAAVMAGALLPLRHLIVVDVQDSRLELAGRLGATEVVNSRDTDAVAALRDLTGGGPECALESSGVPAVLQQAVRSVAIGGTVGVVGVPPFGVTAALDVADLVNDSKRIVGIVEGASNPPVFLPRLAELVASGALPVGALVTTFPLADAERAAEAMKTGAAIKPVLLP
jgi:aryl-alcohol dehydrogenase